MPHPWQSASSLRKELHRNCGQVHYGALFQLPNPLLQELALWFLLGQGQRFLIRRPSWRMILPIIDNPCQSQYLED
jgi:hypothetical protein